MADSSTLEPLQIDGAVAVVTGGANGITLQDLTGSVTLQAVAISNSNGAVGGAEVHTYKFFVRHDVPLRIRLAGENVPLQQCPVRLVHERGEPGLIGHGTQVQ